MPRKTRTVEVVDVLAEEQPAPQPTATRPVPEAQLTPEQRRIRELENLLAQERGNKDPEIELEYPSNPGAKDNILIHFLEDGLTTLGQIWRRGQELEFEVGGQAYRDTCDRFGNTWLSLVDDEFGQVDRWGHVKFRRGPWPGKTYLDAAKVPYEALKHPTKDGVTIAPPTEAELEAAAKAEAKRNRAAPRLPLR